MAKKSQNIQNNINQVSSIRDQYSAINRNSDNSINKSTQKKIGGRADTANIIKQVQKYNNANVQKNDAAILTFFKTVFGTITGKKTVISLLDNIATDIHKICTTYIANTKDNTRYTRDTKLAVSKNEPQINKTALDKDVIKQFLNKINGQSIFKDIYENTKIIKQTLNNKFNIYSSNQNQSEMVNTSNVLRTSLDKYTASLELFAKHIENEENAQVNKKQLLEIKQQIIKLQQIISEDNTNINQHKLSLKTDMQSILQQIKQIKNNIPKNIQFNAEQLTNNILNNNTNNKNEIDQFKKLLEKLIDDNAKKQNNLDFLNANKNTNTGSSNSQNNIISTKQASSNSANANKDNTVKLDLTNLNKQQAPVHQTGNQQDLFDIQLQNNKQVLAAFKNLRDHINNTNNQQIPNNSPISAPGVQQQAVTIINKPTENDEPNIYDNNKYQQNDETDNDNTDSAGIIANAAIGFTKTIGKTIAATAQLIPGQKNEQDSQQSQQDSDKDFVQNTTKQQSQDQDNGQQKKQNERLSQKKKIAGKLLMQKGKNALSFNQKNNANTNTLTGAVKNTKLGTSRLLPVNPIITNNILNQLFKSNTSIQTSILEQIKNIHGVLKTYIKAIQDQRRIKNMYADNIHSSQSNSTEKKDDSTPKLDLTPDTGQKQSGSQGGQSTNDLLDLGSDLLDMYNNKVKAPKTLKKPPGKISMGRKAFRAAQRKALRKRRQQSCCKSCWQSSCKRRIKKSCT